MRTIFLACLLAMSLTVSGQATSFIYQPLTVPRAEDIVAFSNGPQSDGEFRRNLTRAQVVRFLEKGRNNTDPATWPPGGNETFEHPCDGVIVDRAGRVYFWTLANKHGLRLETADGRQAYLQLR